MTPSASRRNMVPPASSFESGRLPARSILRDVADAEAYERFLSLWQDADPALEPQKREAREGLERVRKGMAPVG